MRVSICSVVAGVVHYGLDLRGIGTNDGNTAAQGMLPSGPNPQGSPQQVSPLENDFREIVADCVRLAGNLQKAGQDKCMHGMLDMAQKAQGLLNDYKADILKRSTYGTA